VTDGRTDRQNYDSQDRASIAASRDKKSSLEVAVTSLRLLFAFVTLPALISPISINQSGAFSVVVGFQTLLQVNFAYVFIRQYAGSTPGIVSRGSKKLGVWVTAEPPPHRLTLCVPVAATPVNT